MSRQPLVVLPGGRRRPGCDMCIYGAARWTIEFSWAHELWELEREVCDRCLDAIQDAAEEGLASVWWVEEA